MGIGAACVAQADEAFFSGTAAVVVEGIPQQGMAVAPAVCLVFVHPEVDGALDRDAVGRGAVFHGDVEVFVYA